MTNEILLYHITDLNNLKTIIEQEALLSKNILATIDIGYTDIAEQNIQEKRLCKQIPIPPGGTLHDYVPFYFCPKSPMLYRIHKGYVNTYLKGQKEIIYLIIKRDQLISNTIECIYTDGHAIVEQLTGFYDDVLTLEKLDCAAIHSEKWGYPTYTNDKDMKRRKQAEFLVFKQVPWRLVFGIGVYNAVIKEKVNAIININSNHKPLIKIKEFWYFSS